MYRVEANMYYYHREYESFKNAMIEFNRLNKEGRNVKLFRGKKLIKEINNH